MRGSHPLTGRCYRHRMTSTRKLAWIGGLVAFITGVSGFFMGLLQTSRQAADSRDRGSIWIESTPSDTPPSSAASVPTAPRYLDLRSRELQPNRAWQPHTDQLPRAKFTDGQDLILSSIEQAQQRLDRAARRAFDGAPPVVPHPIDPQSPASCLACHGEPVLVDKKLVPQISHPTYSQCLQCHAAGNGPSTPWTSTSGDLVYASVTSRFEGHRLDHGGTRSYEGAPAVIPHTTWMRENCLSCHGPGGSSALRTSHPSRQSCVQCHPANSSLDQRPLLSGSSTPPFALAQP